MRRVISTTTRRVTKKLDVVFAIITLTGMVALIGLMTKTMLLDNTDQTMTILHQTRVVPPPPPKQFPKTTQTINTQPPPTTSSPTIPPIPELTFSISQTTTRLQQLDQLLVDPTISHLLARDCLDFAPPLDELRAKSYVFVRPEIPPAWVDKHKTLRTKESEDARNHAFKYIYAAKVWSQKNPSGEGSTMEASQRAMKILDATIEIVKGANHPHPDSSTSGGTIINVLDLACGDLTWIPKWLDMHSEISYVGVDIVTSAIQSARQRFPSNLYPNRQFFVHDAVKSPISHIPTTTNVDHFHIILLRHALQHLTTEGAMQVLAHVHTYANKHPVFLLTTTYPDWDSPDVDLIETEFHRVRKLNLQRAPYNFPQPICWAQDFSYSYLALWKLPFNNT